MKGRMKAVLPENQLPKTSQPRKKRPSKTTSMFSEDQVLPTSITKVLVTLNPNKAARSPTAMDQVERDIKNVLREMDREDHLSEICGNNPYVESYGTSDLGLEVGSKQHRVHAHFILEIKHYVLHYSLKKLRERIKEFFDEYGVDLSSNWYVHLTIVPAYKENYATKEKRRAKALAMEDFGNEEYARLADTATESTYRVHNKEINVLDPTPDTANFVAAHSGQRDYNMKNEIEIKEIEDVIGKIESLHLEEK